MQSIERAAAFKKDFKRVKATPKHAKYIDGLLENVLELLITNQPLPDNNKDHHLTGNWVGSVSYTQITVPTNQSA